MAHWLKAAEDLFEVVDRRAKLVVGEQSDELSNSQSPSKASNGQVSHKNRAESTVKPQKQLSLGETPTADSGALQQFGSETLQSEVSSGNDKPAGSVENDGTILSGSTLQRSNNDQCCVNDDGIVLDAPPSSASSVNGGKHGVFHEEDLASVASEDAFKPASNGDLVDEISSKPRDVIPATPVAAESTKVIQVEHEVESGKSVLFDDGGTSKIVDEDKSQVVTADLPSNRETQSNDSQFESGSHVVGKKHQEPKPLASPTKVEDQLNEAQGLLINTNSTGQSKEARLARVCAGLSSRLQEYKSENSQLEELLVAERELSKSYDLRLQQLQKDLSSSKSEVTRVESNMLEALAAKNSEIEILVGSMDALKKQAALAEGNLASLQANMESIMRNRELTETRMMQALREELASAERKAEEERAAHNATKMASMEREVELEHRSLDASTALARVQRIADERTAKAVQLEQKVALLEVECTSLNQELQDMEARARRGQKKSPEEANQVIQMQAWQEEVDRARQSKRDAESKLSSLETDMQKMRVEMAAMKRDAEHYSRQEHMELEKRYRELTDLLYYKQTQLEAMTSEKAAAEFQLEKELKRMQEVQVEVERNRASRRASSSWEEDTDMKALEPLPLHHRHMAAASIQLQKAAKLLDSGAVRATRFLWRYPTARVLLLFYLVFVHLFLMYLLHCLQEQEDTYASREVAKSMGLANHTLP